MRSRIASSTIVLIIEAQLGYAQYIQAGVLAGERVGYPMSIRIVVGSCLCWNAILELDFRKLIQKATILEENRVKSTKYP